MTAEANNLVSATGRILLCSALLLGLLSCTRGPFASKTSVAEKTRADAVAMAKKEDKLVLLVFGIHDQGWSDRLDAYHANPDVRGVLEKYFVIARVDIEEPGGMEMYAERGPRGSPAFSILDTSGAVV